MVPLSCCLHMYLSNFAVQQLAFSRCGISSAGYWSLQIGASLASFFRPGHSGKEVRACCWAGAWPAVSMVVLHAGSLGSRELRHSYYHDFCIISFLILVLFSHLFLIMPRYVVIGSKVFWDCVSRMESSKIIHRESDMLWQPYTDCHLTHYIPCPCLILNQEGDCHQVRTNIDRIDSALVFLICTLGNTVDTTSIGNACSSKLSAQKMSKWQLLLLGDR